MTDKLPQAKFPPYVLEDYLHRAAFPPHIDDGTPPINALDKKPDMVNSPPHYRQGNVECIEAIEAMLTKAEFDGYCKGNVVKYIWRENHKGRVESLKKAQWYLNKLVESHENSST